MDQADGSRFTAVYFYDLGRLGTADEALRIIRSIRFRR